MKKRLTALLTSLIIMMNLVLFPTYASSITPIQAVPELSLETTSTGEQYLLNETTGEKIIKAYTYNKDGTLFEIPLTEYQRIINSTPKIPSSNSNDISFKSESELLRALTYRYDETSSYVALGTPLKVSSELKGPGEVSISHSSTVSCSFGGDVSVSSTIKKKIQAAASFSWNVSLATEVSDTYTFPVPAGKIGYIQFTPYFDVTVGDLYQGHSESSLADRFLGEVWGKSPQKIDTGFANGLFELVTR